MYTHIPEQRRKSKIYQPDSLSFSRNKRTYVKKCTISTGLLALRYVRLGFVAELVRMMPPGDSEQPALDSLTLSSHRLLCNPGKFPGCAALIFPSVTHSLV